MRFQLFSRLNVFQFGLLAVLPLLFTGSGVRADEPRPNKELPAKEIKDSFKSGPSIIQVVRFEPAGAAKRPAVIMLHGCDGWGQMDGYKFAASGLNANGQIAILIRYYDRTKTPDKIAQADRAEFVRWLKGEAVQDKENLARQHFSEWTETVRDAVAYARKLPNVDPDRVAIVGFSLGGFLALAAAPTCEPPVAAVIELFGGLPEESIPRLGKLHPTLILHGDRDTVVSVAEAYKAAGVIAAQKQHVEIDIHKGFGHVFARPGTEQPDLGELLKGRTRMVNFLKERFSSTAEITRK